MVSKKYTSRTAVFRGERPFILRFSELALRNERAIISHDYDDDLTVYPTDNFADSVTVTD